MVKVSNKFLCYLHNVWKMEGDIVYIVHQIVI